MGVFRSRHETLQDVLSVCQSGEPPGDRRLSVIINNGSIPACCFTGHYPALFVYKFLQNMKHDNASVQLLFISSQATRAIIVVIPTVVFAVYLVSHLPQGAAPT